MGNFQSVPVSIAVLYAVSGLAEIRVSRNGLRFNCAWCLEKEEKYNKRSQIERVIRHNDEIALRFLSERDFMINRQRSTWIAYTAGAN